MPRRDDLLQVAAREARERAEIALAATKAAGVPMVADRNADGILVARPLTPEEAMARADARKALVSGR
jgi:hypothetical protein